MKKSICLVPKITAVGGPASFQRRFIDASAAFGVTVHYDPNRDDIGAFLVIGAPASGLAALIRARLRGIPVIQRLNGMNWLHKVLPSGRLYGLKADFANRRIAWVRRYLATAIVYQSRFCEENWNSAYGTLSKRSTLIYNGVDTGLFSPGADTPTDWRAGEPIRVLIAEGNIQRGAEIHLTQALRLCASLMAAYPSPVTLTIAGNVPAGIRERTAADAAAVAPSVELEWKGVVTKDALIALERSATVFLPIEPQPACPNAVIEALSVGLPVIGYDTGSLADVVGPGGVIAPYGADVRRLEPPDPESLVSAARRVLENRASFSAGARRTALERFRVDNMAEAYLKFCLG